MRLDLENARDQAHVLRFAGERLSDRPTNVSRPDAAVRMSRRWGLEVAHEVTPGLFRVIMNACSKFGLEPTHVRAFVHPAATMQAHCASADGRCLVELSSALVEQLDESEQAFVVGHELGHFLLDHHYLPLPPETSFERYQLLRAREISADRIGLIACDSVEAAIRATMKTFSGLSNEHLRFDAAAFLRNAFNEDNRVHAQSQPEDTHPSFAVRARSLVQFAAIMKDQGSNGWKAEFERVEKRIERDFLTYGEAGVEARLSEIEESLGQWIWVSSFVADGHISTAQFEKLSDRFGPQFAKSVKDSFSGMAKSEVSALVERNLSGVFMAFSNAVPTSAARRATELAEQCESALGLKPFSHPVRKRIVQ